MSSIGHVSIIGSSVTGLVSMSSIIFGQLTVEVSISAKAIPVIDLTNCARISRVRVTLTLIFGAGERI